MKEQEDIIKRSWDEWSDSWYVGYRTEEVIANINKQPESAFHPTTFSMIMKAFPDLRGKRICVPSSGDNHAVFAFHLKGLRLLRVTFRNDSWRIVQL
ncbi:hypothetical protein J14TS5_11410 [Paenibacillus lautus]|uniref:hypothetical protein n=1 Tax=Paenibacillus lautus TaxID=1401 RepID=UPI001B1BB532|nr:hypothetical protein [Paenibacillus lautus]GIO96055.1 hypothetical protein J14TS5_11410 [Paenibacillus lautus]